MTIEIPSVDPQQIAAYLDMLFGFVDFEPSDSVRLRGIGEKGTDKEGKFREKVALDPSDVDIVVATERAAKRWAEHSIATFIVPAVMTGGDDKEDNVRAFTTIVADLDKGDTAGKLAHLGHHLGQPTMVVRSGGLTDAGHPKYHVYWRFTEPMSDTAHVARLRDQLALKVGDDPSFKRMTQVIRVPGSIHGKNGVRALCSIFEHNSALRYDFDELAERITAMPPIRGVVMPVETAALDFAPRQSGQGLVLDFNRPEAGDDAWHDTGKALTTDVRSGGVDGTTRWDSFNQVAGHYLRAARIEEITIDEARNFAHGWMLAHMQPVWPEDRFRTEWQGLLDHDVATKGPLRSSAPQLPAATLGASHVVTPWASSANMFERYVVAMWLPDARPDRKFLVKGWITMGEPHLVVASGGAGKTFMMLDFAIKLASYQPTCKYKFLNGELTEHCTNAAVAVLTTEDSMDELATRIHDMDPQGLARAAGNRLIVMPTASDRDGAFTICERDGKGNFVASVKWRQITDHLLAIPNLKAVVIDTFNAVMHGDENSATAIAEFRRAAFGPFIAAGVTIIFTHHPRKLGNRDKIMSAEDMAQAVRGSGALLAAFRVGIGIWPAWDYEKRLKAMGLRPEKGKLWMAAIIKANNNEVYSGERTLIRNSVGLLDDVTDRDVYRGEAAEIGSDRQLDWLLFIIKRGAVDGYPFTSTGNNSPAKRKGQLPEEFRRISGRKLDEMVEVLTSTGRLVRCAIGTATQKTMGYLDAPDGPCSKGKANDGPEDYETGTGAWTSPDWSKFTYSELHGGIVPMAAATTGEIT